MPIRAHKHDVLVRGHARLRRSNLVRRARHARLRLQRCRAPREPAIRVEDLDAEIGDFLTKVELRPNFQKWVLDRLEQAASAEAKTHGASAQASEAGIAVVARQLDTLTTMRVRELLTDEQYLRQREGLEREQLRLQRAAAKQTDPQLWLQPARTLVSFGGYLVPAFERAELPRKRFIAQVTGCNPSLRDKKLSIQAKKPYRVREILTSIPGVRWGWDSNPRAPFGADGFRDRPVMTASVPHQLYTSHIDCDASDYSCQSRKNTLRSLSASAGIHEAENLDV